MQRSERGQKVHMDQNMAALQFIDSSNLTLRCHCSPAHSVVVPLVDLRAREVKALAELVHLFNCPLLIFCELGLQDHLLLEGDPLSLLDGGGRYASFRRRGRWGGCAGLTQTRLLKCDAPAVP